MRWTHYGVDFEPAGKDHHSDGGSFSTADMIVRKVFTSQPPASFQYDFVGIKGLGGKMSSSTGEALSLHQVLAIYQPQIVRYMFSRSRPNSEFTLSFDLDVIKIYEDYDRCERNAFGKDSPSEKKQKDERRIWELSQVGEIPSSMPTQLPFRHLCTFLQIDGLSPEKTLKRYFGAEIPLVAMQRVECALNWLRDYAPEEFLFRLAGPDEPLVKMTAAEKSILRALRRHLKSKAAPQSGKEWKLLLQELATQGQISMQGLCVACYKLLISREQGPRLVSFLQEIGLAALMQALDKLAR